MYKGNIMYISPASIFGVASIATFIASCHIPQIVIFEDSSNQTDILFDNLYNGAVVLLFQS